MANLQRKDLADHFSDIVQQEIKNHNDSILATNIALNEIRLQIDEIKAAHEHQGNQCHSLFVGLGNQLELFEDTLTNSVEELQRKVNDKADETKTNLLAMKKSFEDRESYFMPIDGFDQFKEKIEQWSANIQRAFAVQKDSLFQDTRRISEDTRQAIEIVRKAIEKSIAQEIEDRKEQDVTLDHFAVNFSGMQQEIERLKKRSFIIEKNIENIYTQIERLKAAK